MRCKIAGLGVEVPEIGDLPERCRQYLDNVPQDIIIEADRIKLDTWHELSVEDNVYLNSGFQFYRRLMDFDGLMLHSSCVVVDGYAYLFSGPCGIGKSTHAAKYLEAFPGAVIINDDKPALRRIDGKWYAFGTPWCGKDGINANVSAPIAGICFLHRGDTALRRLSPLEAVGYILRQTNGRSTPKQGEKLMRLLDKLVTELPVFEFYNSAAQGDELITFNAMRDAANERN